MSAIRRQLPFPGCPRFGVHYKGQKKGWYVKNVSNKPPFIHDLVRLAEKAKLELEEDQKDLLDTISAFNLRARYDDYKMEFYQKCSKNFAEKWIDIIREFREWMKKKLVI